MRIAYVLLTCEKLVNTRAKWQLETCLSTVPTEDIYYLGHIMDPEKRIYNWGAHDGYNELPEKLIDVFKNKTFDDYDWIFIADDDTYIFHQRISKFLAKYNAKVAEPYTVFGHTLDHVKNKMFEYYSGGAGTILTRDLYNEVVEQVKQYKIANIHWCADICLGKWLLDTKERLTKEGKQMMMINIAHYLHTDYYNPKKDDIKTALTFHHLKEKSQYLELYVHEYNDHD